MHFRSVHRPAQDRVAPQPRKPLRILVLPRLRGGPGGAEGGQGARSSQGNRRPDEDPGELPPGRRPAEREMNMPRVDGRKHDQLRPIKITEDFVSSAEASCLIEVGKTRILCCATLDDEIPRWLKGKGKG